jgi:hypothetical protein
MPSSTPKEAVVMAARAHGWVPRNSELRRIPVAVAKEFNAADRGGETLARGARASARARALRRRAAR